MRPKPLIPIFVVIFASPIFGSSLPSLILSNILIVNNTIVIDTDNFFIDAHCFQMGKGFGDSSEFRDGQSRKY